MSSVERTHRRCAIISAPLEPRFPAPYIAGMAEALTLTEAAANRVGAIARKQGKPAILRLSVEGGGCSGTFAFARGQRCAGMLIAG